MQMRLSSVVKKSLILPAMESETKFDAVSELARLLQRRKIIEDQEMVVQRVMERESLETTALGNGIAIPHARSPQVKNMVCAVGRTKEGLDFRAFDGKPTRLVFLILYPSADSSAYLLFLSALMNILQDESFCQKLVSAPDSGSIFNLLKEAHASLAEKEEKDLPSRKGIFDDSQKRVEEGDISLLVRLHRFEKFADAQKRKNPGLADKIKQMRSCVPQRTLAHYQKLRKRSGDPIVPVEGGVCDGCKMRLPSQFFQELSMKPGIFTCPNCRRFLYLIGTLG